MGLGNNRLVRRCIEAWRGIVTNRFVQTVKCVEAARCDDGDDNDAAPMVMNSLDGFGPGSKT